MYNSNNANSGINVIPQIHKFGGMKDNADDDGDEGDELLRANTRANAGNEGLEEESDISSQTGTDTDATDATDATESVSTGMSDVDDDDDLDELMMDEDAAPAETPAMLAKKTATAASASANSDAKKKAVIANKRAIASSKPPKGKATLQDITTLQNSYDDIANDDDDLGESDNGSDEDDDGPNNYLRKFERETHENYIESCHQEMMHLNNAEVAALARVIRNADGVIVDALHKTMPFLTKYEKTRILGQRAKQLNQGAQPMIPVDKKIIDGYLIAQLELQQKALPFIIRRPLPGGKSEYWRLADLEII
jgi:DNA-directed RNA polymerase I, II, and III subunit RPABC2